MATLTLEHSLDGITWVTWGTLLGDGSEQRWVATGLRPFVRVRWSGMTEETMTSCVGTAETSYCSLQDVFRFGCPPVALEEVPISEIAEACLACSDEADGYIGGAYRLPLSAWGTDLRMHVAKMATLLVFERRGFDPGGPDAQIVTGRTRAVEWLNRLANGRLSPPGMVDQTPPYSEGGAVVVSAPLRGW